MASSPPADLDDAAQEFDRNSAARRVTAAAERAEQIRSDFPREGWPSMALERYVYFPDEFLPVYAQAHVLHFTQKLTGSKPPDLTPIAANRRLLELVRGDGRLAGWDPMEVMQFLYWWADPRTTRAIVKIAPGD